MKIKLLLAAVTAILAALSAIAFYSQGSGFTSWCWQILCIVWIFSCYRLEKKVTKLSNLLNKVENNK